MFAISTLLGGTAFVAAAILILKAMFSRGRPAIQSARTADDQREAVGYAALDNRRIDMRLALVLLVAGAILALPELMGVTLSPTTLVIVASLLALFVNAYSRYAKRLRAGQPGPIPALYSRDAAEPQKPSHIV